MKCNEKTENHRQIFVQSVNITVKNRQHPWRIPMSTVAYSSKIDNIDQALKYYFGYDSFRQGQREVIASILGGSDVLAVMPTGSGKSVCYQLPALMLSGITIVISPLISLMRDQVAALGAAGIRAAYINSTLTPGQCSHALSNAAQGDYKIIYVAPERLLTPQFLNFAQKADISLVAVDEAHCVSQWGHDFRRSYLEIEKFVSGLSKRPITAAFTATATDHVKDDISELLGLRSPAIYTTGYDRPGLYFGVETPSNKVDYIFDFIKRRPGKVGIIYCATRRQVDLLCAELIDRGVNAVKYHAGLSEAQRNAAQDDFIYDRCPIIVATNAFGMGIDKSNVAFVLHYGIPLSMEAYYQEAGRAGRDGSNAECVLLYEYRDVMVAKFLIENSGVSEDCSAEEAEKLKKINLTKLARMEKYCNSTTCLRKNILSYFGEEYKSNSCGKCSSCKKKSHALTLDSMQLAIGGVILKTGGRYGCSAIVDILSGKRTERLVERGYDRLFEFGSFKLHKKNDIRSVIDDMLSSGLLYKTSGEYPLLKVTDKYLSLSSAKAPEGRHVNIQQKTYADQDLLEELKIWRKRTASVAGLPPYIVLTDMTLEQISVEKPACERELIKIRGISEKKIQKYGKEIIGIVKKHTDHAKN